MRLIVLHHVKLQMLEASLWYQKESPGLGADFVDEVERAFESIAQRPQLYATVYRDARHSTLKRFPYGVYFVIRNDIVYIFALSHLQRSPRVWQRLLPRRPRTK